MISIFGRIIRRRMLSAGLIVTASLLQACAVAGAPGITLGPTIVSAEPKASVTTAPAVRDTPFPTALADSSDSPPGFVDPTEAAAMIAQCPVVGDVAYYFSIPQGSEFRAVFPSAGRAPELEGRDGLFVVLYSGEVMLTNLAHATSAPDGPTFRVFLQNVVCIVSDPMVTGDVYYDLSLTDMKLPPGAHEGLPAH
jgi:hypothetical protein